MGLQGSAKKKAKASEAPRRKAAEGKREATIRTAKDLYEFQRLRDLMNEHSVASMAAIPAAALAFGLWLLHPMMLRWVVPAALVWWCLRTVFVASFCVPLALSWYATASYSSTLWRVVVVALATMALQLGAMLLTTLFLAHYGDVDAKFKYVQAIAESVDDGLPSSSGRSLSESSQLRSSTCSSTSGESSRSAERYASEARPHAAAPGGHSALDQAGLTDKQCHMGTSSSPGAQLTMAVPSTGGVVRARYDRLLRWEGTWIFACACAWVVMDPMFRTGPTFRTSHVPNTAPLLPANLRVIVFHVGVYSAGVLLAATFPTNVAFSSPDAVRLFRVPVVISSLFGYFSVTYNYYSSATHINAACTAVQMACTLVQAMVWLAVAVINIMQCSCLFTCPWRFYRAVFATDGLSYLLTTLAHMALGPPPLYAPGNISLGASLLRGGGSVLGAMLWTPTNRHRIAHYARRIGWHHVTVDLKELSANERD